MFNEDFLHEYTPPTKESLENTSEEQLHKTTPKKIMGVNFDTQFLFLAFFSSNFHHDLLVFWFFSVNIANKVVNLIRFELWRHTELHAHGMYAQRLH